MWEQQNLVLARHQHHNICSRGENLPFCKNMFFTPQFAKPVSACFTLKNLQLLFLFFAVSVGVTRRLHHLFSRRTCWQHIRNMRHSDDTLYTEELCVILLQGFTRNCPGTWCGLKTSSVGWVNWVEALAGTALVMSRSREFNVEGNLWGRMTATSLPDFVG